MPFTTTGKNKMLDTGKTSITHIGAFSDLGVTEVVGATRQAITWTAAAAGLTDNNAQLSIPMGAGLTAVTLGFFDAVSAGNILGYWPIGSAGQVVRGVGTADSATDLVRSVAHGVTTDDRVFFWPGGDAALPAGLSAGTLYFVKAAGLTADLFAVALTSGGAAVDITASGELAFAKTVPNLWASAGNLVVATGALDLDLNFA
jgi:hypothetical protein